MDDRERRYLRAKALWRRHPMRGKPFYFECDAFREFALRKCEYEAALSSIDKLSDASDAFAPAQCSAVRPEIVEKPNKSGSK